MSELSAGDNGSVAVRVLTVAVHVGVRVVVWTLMAVAAVPLLVLFAVDGWRDRRDRQQSGRDVAAHEAWIRAKGWLDGPQVNAAFRLPGKR